MRTRTKVTVVSRLAGRLLRLPRPITREVAVERALRIAMPDGVALLADRWSPEGHERGEARPTVLIRTPYGRKSQQLVARLLAERGFHVVVQSCRGTFGSEGAWEPFRHEAVDGRATLAWMLEQSWCNGPIVTLGGSYVGLTQWAVAADPPPELRAMALSVTAANVGDGFVFPGGAFSLESALTWLHQLEHQERGTLRALWNMARAHHALKPAYAVLPLRDTDRLAVGRPVAFYQDWLAHDRAEDPWWEVVDFSRDLNRVPPTTMLTGWYDMFLPAQVDDFVALRAAGRDVRLTIGPWTHTSPAIVGAHLRDALDWYGEVLSDSSTHRSRVRVFVMGDDRWVELPDWPPPADVQRWHLWGDGTLAIDGPALSRPRSYSYDPADPSPAIGGASLNFRTSGPKNQRARETRRDVLTYTSASLARELTVIGPVSAVLHLTSDAEHFDVFVRLCDVTPSGRSTNLSDGFVRVRPESAVRGVDGAYTVRVSMSPTANTFKAGHGLRVQVSGSMHPRFARNPGTGEPTATATTLRASRHEILDGPDHPSMLHLPVCTFNHRTAPSSSAGWRARRIV
jgi:putative CocE/NonD family hydrolase